jgi:nucleotide-binding universal stress UspA family protein
MSYKSLLICLDERPRAEVTAEFAIQLANECGASVVGAYLGSSLRTSPVYGLDVGIGMAAMDAEYLKLITENAKNTEAMFKTKAAAAQKPIDRWLSLERVPWPEIAAAARCVDLCVIGQAELEGSVTSYYPDLPAVLAMGSGKPVLVLPAVGAYSQPGRRVLVAWNGQREAARAVADALPFLDSADSVAVVAVGPLPKQATLDEFRAYLSCRGITPQVEHVPATDTDAGDLLLSRAADLGADLLVMGAYGHSRLREMVFGGVTRNMLRHMTLPVLLSY